MQRSREVREILNRLDRTNEQANPGLSRLALKLATGAGKTTVMAMLIAWQTINPVRRPNSRILARGFLVITPGLTIRDRLRVLQPKDPESYHQSRELMPRDMVADLDHARIVITNYHAFKLREMLDLSRVSYCIWPTIRQHPPSSQRGRIPRGRQTLKWVVSR